MDDLDFWQDAWDAGVVASRLKRADNTLEMHWSAVDAAPSSRVLVPLCGKSGDLKWLAERGYAPVGVEVSEIPCREFFAEAGVEPDQIPHGRFVAWRGAGVTILQGDFYDLEESFDVAVDRGGLVAVAPPTRARYATHLNARLTLGAPILLVVIEFDPALRNGPPYPVFPDEMRRLFPGAVELGRGPMERRKWQRLGGAEAVVWAAEAATQ